MTGKTELEGMCDEMGGEWIEPGDPNPADEFGEEPLDEGVYVCDMGKSSFTLFRASEAPDDIPHDEVVVREHDTDSAFTEIDPYQMQMSGGTLIVEGVDGHYYDGFTNHRIDNGTVRIYKHDGTMEVEQTQVY